MQANCNDFGSVAFKEIFGLHLELGHGSVDEKEGLVDTIAESGELE